MLDQSQQRRLRLKTQRADFVQKQRALRRFSYEPAPLTRTKQSLLPLFGTQG